MPDRQPTTGTENHGPLKGIRVIELARVLAGPWAGQVMADLGADVIKIEQPGAGDETRLWGPPFIEGKSGENLSAAYFHATNRGKRSIAVDIKTEAGQEIVRELVRTADVLVENFKVGGLARYGLDHESLSAINPRLVYCSITGFGQTGPKSGRPGYDFIVQGMSGFMAITGEPEGEPMKAGVAIADIFTGLYAVVAIEAALLHVQKTGEGQHVDMALLDAQAAVLANQNMNFLATGRDPARAGNAHVNIAPYEVIEVADGYIILGVGNDGQFARLCGILGLDALPGDPLFIDNRNRIRHRRDLTEALLESTRKWRRDDLVKACEDNGVPAGPINKISDMFSDPQIAARGLRIDLEDESGNVIPGVRTPIMMSRTPLFYDRPSPRHDEHGDDIRAEIARGGQKKNPA